MSVSRRHALLAGAVLPVSALLAQGQSPGASGQAQPDASRPNAPGADPLLAACLLIGGRKQIENCNFALTKLQSEDVKAFAKAEVEEHENMKDKLQKLGYEYPVKPATAPGGNAQSGAAQQGEAGQQQQQPQPGDRPQPVLVSAGRMRLPVEAAALLAVDHEVADRCIANYRREMGQLTGVKLDKRFVGHQLDEHLALKDKVETFRKHASADLAPALDEGLKTINMHIATCKQLMDKLDGAAPAEKDPNREKDVIKDKEVDK